jgi:hypothetical protein
MDPSVLSNPKPAAPEPAMAAPFDDTDTAEHMWARTSARSGMIAMGLCMAAPCTCGGSYLLALPIAGITMWLARGALSGAVPDSATRAYAKIGMISGVTSFIFSCAFMLGGLAWTMWWFGLVFLSSM